jgi:hypothetical protein
MALIGVRFRFIGIGLVSVGLGARIFLSAFANGLNVALLVLGGLVAGFGGLYFIAASDRIFKPNQPTWRRPSKTSSEQKELDDRSELIER